MVVFGQNLAKVVVFKIVLFGQNWLYSGKVVVLLQRFYSGKVDILGQKGLYSGNTAVFGKNGCIRAKWLYSEKSG